MGSTTVNSAPPRDYAKETGDTLATQIALAPDLYNSEALYQPKYNQLQMQLAQEAVLGRESGFNTQAYAQSRPDLARNWQNSLNNPEGATESNILKYGSFENYLNADWEASGADSRFATGGKSGGLIQTYAGLQPQLSAISAQSNYAQRAADIADVAKLGPAATEAFKKANPDLFAQLQAAGQLQGSNNQALTKLNAGLATAPGQQNISAQQITGPNINAQMVGRENTTFGNISPTDIAAQQIGSQGQLGYNAVNAAGTTARTVGAQDVTAQQLTSPGSVQAQQLSAAQVGAPGTVGADRVGAALIETPAQVEARNVRARAMQAQQVAAPQQVQAGLIQPGTLGSSLYGQALNAGPSKISSALESAVLNNLTSDGSLSVAEQRQAEQQVRASYAARGMAMSPQAISAEVQNRLVNQRQRSIENMGLAGQVNQQLQSEQAANRGFAGNVFGQDVSMQQQNIGNQFSAGQFNAQTGLQAGLANQAAGNQIMQQNAANQMQAQLANQSAGLQAGQFNASTSIQAQQANQDALLRAQLANQQAGIQTGQFNVQTGLQAGLANQEAANQMALANQQAGLQAGQFNVQTQAQMQQANQDAALRAALANQQAQLSAAGQTAQYGTAADQFNAQQSMQAQLANQQAGMQTGQYNIGNATTLAQLNQAASMQAALANQQYNMQGQQFNATNQSQVAQANRDSAMQSSLANQAANLQQQQLMAQYGYQTQAANQQANLGTDESNRAYQAQQLQNYYQNLGQAGQLYNQNMGADRAYSAQLVGLQQATMSDPYQAILGRPSAAFAQQQGISGQGANLTQMGGPALFNPESSYANNIYGGNQQATNAANIATAQNNAALIGGAMQGLGSLAGGSLGAAAFNKAFPCWVAREVYGVNDPKWKRFRTWLLTRAPKWFHDFYCKYGAQFAEFISDKPRTKSLIRRWMDSRIATLK
jgi:hypothetical protein